MHSGHATTPAAPHTGHEQGQTVGSTVLPFDDVAEVATALEAAHV